MSVATQTLTGLHVDGTGAGVAGRSVRAVPAAGVSASGATVDGRPVTVAGRTAPDGSWSLELLQGVTYDLTIEHWGTRTITVTTDAAKDFATYLSPDLSLAAPEYGSIRAKTGEALTPEVVEVVNEDGSTGYAINWRVL
jgi:hypothetical protein